MEKRILIAFLLSFAVLYAFRFVFPPPTPDRPGAESTAPAPAAVTTPTLPPEPEVVPQESLQAEAAEDAVVDTAMYRAVVSNAGGVLKSFRLKDYLDGEKKPLELIDAYAGSKVGFPLAITTGDASIDKILSGALFVVRQEGAYRLSLEYSGVGVQARKTLEFDPETYAVAVATDVRRNGASIPHQVLLQGRFGDQSIPDAPAMRGAVYTASSQFDRIAVTGIEEPQEVAASLAGIEDQYFLAMLISETPGPVKISGQDYVLPDLPDGTKGAAMRGLSVAVTAAGPIRLYLGPKLQESLVRVDPRLGDVINFGWPLFAVIAKPLLVGLRWVYGYAGNYGWAIVILTFIINMVLFPLRVKQQLGMQKMQKNMPHLKQLQEKYKKLKAGDPKRAPIEKELMEMNKQQLSGCLPMVLQIPVFLGFYNMMFVAIELRGAPWIFWINDLSQPDRWNVLPLLMGVAMFVQMKMSPTSPDPAQAKMMLITPVLVTILFLWYQSASGLTLYWFTGNVIGIAQQWFIRKYWSGEDSKPRGPHREAAPA